MKINQTRLSVMGITGFSPYSAVTESQIVGLNANTQFYSFVIIM